MNTGEGEGIEKREGWRKGERKKYKEGSEMPGILVFKLLKLQYVHKLQTGGMHHIDLVHLMTKKIEKGE